MALKPAVSVVTAMHNRPRWLADAIESVLNQSLTNLELIVVDDGCINPECVRIVKKYMKRDRRIRLVQLPFSQGVVAARNSGIQAAKGACIGLLDDDDLYEAHALQTQFDLLEQHPEVAACSTQLIAMQDTGRMRGLHGSDRTQIFPINQDPEQLSRIDICQGAMMRTKAVRDLGGYRHWFSRCAEDWDLSKRAEERYAMAHLGQPLYRYRRHANSLTHGPECALYALAARICAFFRRQAKPYDPVDDAKTLWQVLELLPHTQQVMTNSLNILMDSTHKMAEQALKNEQYSRAASYLERYNSIVAACPDKPPAVRSLHIAPCSISGPISVPN
ncbi:MAG: glycosyltransferase family 2 protein [Gammaproteobacteria bacterium]